MVVHPQVTILQATPHLERCNDRYPSKCRWNSKSRTCRNRGENSESQLGIPRDAALRNAPCKVDWNSFTDLRSTTDCGSKLLILTNPNKLRRSVSVPKGCAISCLLCRRICKRVLTNSRGPEVANGNSSASCRDTSHKTTRCKRPISAMSRLLFSGANLYLSKTTSGERLNARQSLS